LFVTFKTLEEIDERDKAIGVPITHNEVKKIMWIPKSLIENKNGWKKQKMVDVPDWFYDKKFADLFLQGRLFSK